MFPVNWLGVESNLEYLVLEEQVFLSESTDFKPSQRLVGVYLFKLVLVVE